MNYKNNRNVALYGIISHNAILVLKHANGIAAGVCILSQHLWLSDGEQFHNTQFFFYMESAMYHSESNGKLFK